jgi:hypothetical protein
MFEPLNALERALMAAATDPSARAAFTQALLQSELYISPAGDQPADGGIGQLVISHLEQGDTPCVFTAPERIAAAVGAGAAVRGMPGRALFEELRIRGVHINPNCDFGVVYSPADVAEILDGVRQEVVAKDEKILLGHPAERPEALIKALSARLATLQGVKGAWILLAHRASEPEPSWLVGVDHDGDWEAISRAIGEVVAVTDLGGKTLSATPLQRNSLAASLRGGIPIVAPKKRGLFDFLKG